MHTALAVAAALVSLAFAFSTYDRWTLRRQPHELTWSVALAMFSAASWFLAAGAGLGWNAALFRGFYLFGAVANVPVLAVGTLQLLCPRRLVRPIAAAVGLGVAFAAGIVVAAPLTAAVPPEELARGSEVFGPLPRILAAVASGGGAAVVLGGALWSAARRRDVPRQVAANALIALGTAITGASGLLNSVLDEMTGFAVTLVAGITVLFAGFLVATAGRGAAASRPVRAAATPRT